MPSERQRAAHCRNGRLGGPKTEQGKRRSRRNSLRHGLTSTTLVVLPEENGREYEEILRGFRESLQPGGALEDALVARLAGTHWRGLRSRRVETGMLDITAASQRDLARQLVEDCSEHLDPQEAIGVTLMTAPPDQWHSRLRYDTTISREFCRTLDTLARHQHARRMKRAGEASVMVAAGAAEVSDSGIRSVSQNHDP